MFDVAFKTYDFFLGINFAKNIDAALLFVGQLLSYVLDLHHFNRKHNMLMVIYVLIRSAAVCTAIVLRVCLLVLKHAVVSTLLCAFSCYVFFTAQSKSILSLLANVAAITDFSCSNALLTAEKAAMLNSNDALFLFLLQQVNGLKQRLTVKLLL